MAKVGDKFIIEVGAVQKHYGVNFIKGIEHLSVSDDDLEKLEKYEPNKMREDEIKIGDEVIGKDGKTFIVTLVSGGCNWIEDKVLSGIRNSGDYIGNSVIVGASKVRKTGRRHEFLASVIEDLKKYK